MKLQNTLRISRQIDDESTAIFQRLAKKIDAFSHMALIAAEMALQDSGIDKKRTTLVEFSG